MNGLEQYADTYEILEKLGEGSGGIVYKAYHKRLQKVVVLKKMRTRSISSVVNRQEVDILKNLNHSFLPQVLDFIITGNEVYTVMSYVPGKSFQQLLKEGYRFSQNQLIRWGMQLCSALNYLHSQNPPIIHGDIKPANIMLTPQGNICLIDFNISFFLDGDSVLGYSSGYTSPEQYIIALEASSGRAIPNHFRIDEKADLYSLGATMYHLATGVKLADHNAPVDKQLLEESTTEAFAQVLIRALEKRPQKRFESAFAMFQAFQGITKRDGRYRSLLRKQLAARLALVVLMSGFTVLGGYGIHEMKVERTERYNELVEQQTKCREKRDYEKMEAYFREAKKQLPSGLESYYQKAYALYQQREYGDCIAFIEYDIMKNEKIDGGAERMSDVYYLKADSHFQLGEYQKSADAFEVVRRMGTKNPLYYRDYAIALAYNGSAKKAEEVLEDAVGMGLTEDSIFYAKGEIEKSLAHLMTALEDFRSCIECTEDDNLKARAYVLGSKVCRELDQREEERDLLIEAERVLPEESQLLVLERLIQVNIDMAESSGYDWYRDDAISGLKKVIDRGWATYATYDNLVILYQKQEDLGNAQEMLAQMQELFGEDYNIYKRYAFLEIDLQEKRRNEERNYAEFGRYYRLAEELYYEQLQNQDTDAEMGLLENVYNQVKAGGWL